MTRDEKIIEISGTLLNLVPWVGGALASILLGISGDRRFARVADFLVDLDERVGRLSDDQGQLVRTEDFEDLLSETLFRVSRERNDEKRRIYALFLADVIENPGEPYDEQLRFIRILEQLQGDHLRIIRALAYDPPDDGGQYTSRMYALKERLPEIDPTRVEDLANELADLRVIDVGMTTGIITGAAEKHPAITRLGERFVRFLAEEQE